VTDLRVMSYNVHMQRDDLAALAAVVRGAAPDVVIVQEAPRHFRWRAKCAELARAFGLVVVEAGPPALGNLLLASLRVRAHETWSIRLPFTPGRHMRGAAFAVCSIGPSRFAVAGTHLSIDPAERPDQAARVSKALAEIDVPVVVGADVNETCDDPAWQALADGLVDAAEHTGHGDHLTFSCADPRRRIDGIFVDPRITVNRYQVIDTPESRRASDHFPLVVDLALPGTA